MYDPLFKHDDSPDEAPDVLFIGVGNPYRGDDGVGPVIARRLRRMRLPGAAVIEATGEGAALMEAWADAPHVVIFDAVRSGAPPGTIHRLDPHERPIPTGFFHYSTHAFSLAEAVETARVLDRLPPRVVVYGIEGKSFAACAELSSEVEAAVERVLAAAIEELAAAAETRADMAETPTPAT